MKTFKVFYVVKAENPDDARIHLAEEIDRHLSDSGLEFMSVQEITPEDDTKHDEEIAQRLASIRNAKTREEEIKVALIANYRLGLGDMSFFRAENN